MSDASQRGTSVRYQPDENPPAALAFGCGLQLVVLGVASIVLIPTIVIRAAGASDAYLSWAVALLGERPDDVLMEREVSLRLLRHIASSVRHQQFHETDIVTVRVEAPETNRERR